MKPETKLRMFGSFSVLMVLIWFAILIYLLICLRLGCESVDGTGWFRDPSRKDKLPFIEKVITRRLSQLELL